MHLTTKTPTGAESPDGRHLTAEQAREESARRVASGHLPLQRMEAPGIISSGFGDAVVCMANGKPTMFVQTASGGAQTVVAEEEIASQVTRWAAGCVVFADRASLSAVVRRLERSASGAERQRGRSIAYMCRLPLNGKYAVLTDALATRYFAPVERPTLGTWREAFGIDRRLSAVQAISELVAVAASGEVPVIPGAATTLAASGKSVYAGLCGGAPSSALTFKAINAHADVWAAVERTDPLLRQNALRSGDTAAAVPFKMLGGIVECTVSTPFKLRPGADVLVWQDDAIALHATLLELGYDQETQGLTARFTAPATGKRKRNGYDLLFDGLRDNESFFATTAPYISTSGRFASKASGPSWKSGQSVTRELPLYVSLAAAAASGSKV